MATDSDYSGEWYLPVDDGGSRLYILERGTGPVVLAVHGGPGDDHGYLRDALGPMEESHRVVYFDQRGSIRSPMPVEQVTFDGVVDDFRVLVEALGHDAVQVVAHSMGCVMTAAALARYPTLFAEVLLINPGPLRANQPLPPPTVRRREVVEELARMQLDREPLTAKENTQKWRICFAGINLYHVERWPQMGGGGVFYNQSVGDAVSAGMPADYDFLPGLRAHQHSVTIAVGDHDFVDPGAVHALAAGGGAVRTVVVADAGHNMWVDQPKQFADLILAALRSS